MITPSDQSATEWTAHQVRADNDQEAIQLTAVAPPKRAVGSAAVELLLRRLDDRSELPVHHLRLMPELKVRTSCGGSAG